MILGSVAISNTLKVGHFTIDNAGNNGTAMAELVVLHDVEFDAEDCRVMCFEHIVNLSMGRVHKGLTKVLAETVDKCVAPPLPTSVNQSYSYAVKHDPVALGCTAIRAICTSRSCREAFDDVIKTGNEKGWFRDGTPFKPEN